MTLEEAHERLLAQSDAIDLIAKELTWLLGESAKKNVQPGTPLAEELLQKFFSLYKDYRKVKAETHKLCYELNFTEFDEDRTLGLVYQATGQMLSRKVCEGLFEQFMFVAETGKLPEGDFPA